MATKTAAAAQSAWIQQLRCCHATHSTHTWTDADWRHCLGTGPATGQIRFSS